MIIRAKLRSHISIYEPILIESASVEHLLGRKETKVERQTRNRTRQQTKRNQSFLLTGILMGLNGINAYSKEHSILEFKEKVKKILRRKPI